MYWKYLQGTVLAHAIGILLHMAVISQERLVDLLVAEEKVAKLAYGDVRTFGNSDVVCLGARLARKTETITSMLVFVLQFHNPAFLF